jgi:hypothetical protein
MLALMLCGGFIATMVVLLFAVFDSQGTTRFQYVPLSLPLSNDLGLILVTPGPTGSSAS